MSLKPEIFTADVVEENVSDSLHSNTTGTTVGTKRGLNTAAINQSILDPGNSTIVTLGAGATYTGATIDISNYISALVMIYSDVDSAAGGLVFQTSIDGTNWDHGHDYFYEGLKGLHYEASLPGQYFRIQYTNGASIQTVFRLSTKLSQGPLQDHVHAIDKVIDGEHPAKLTRSVLTALNDSGAFENIGSTKSNNLRVSDAENGLSIAKGDVAGTTFIHKFGNAPDFDTADGEVYIWDGANDAGLNQMEYIFSTTADIDSLSSSSNSDTQAIEVQGLDTNYDLVTQTITLTGQTRVALTTTLIRVFRLKNVGTVDIVGNVYCYVNGAISGGVPTVSTTVRSVILADNNQTELTVYTIPAGKTGYIRSWFASSAGARKDTNYVIKLKFRPFGQVFQLKHRTAISDAIALQHINIEPEVAAAKTDIIMTARITAGSITQANVSAGFDLVLIDD